MEEINDKSIRLSNLRDGIYIKRDDIIKRIDMPNALELFNQMEARNIHVENGRVTSVIRFKEFNVGWRACEAFFREILCGN